MYKGVCVIINVALTAEIRKIFYSHFREMNQKISRDIKYHVCSYRKTHSLFTLSPTHSQA